MNGEECADFLSMEEPKTTDERMKIKGGPSPLPIQFDPDGKHKRSASLAFHFVSCVPSFKGLCASSYIM